MLLPKLSCAISASNMPRGGCQPLFWMYINPKRQRWHLPQDWQWFHARLHGDLAGQVVRSSASAVNQEMLQCYELVERLGRGVVYYGSARLGRDSPHWQRSVELGRGVALLLGSTTWTGEPALWYPYFPLPLSFVIILPASWCSYFHYY